jgi:hypothetical protein
VPDRAPFTAEDVLRYSLTTLAVVGLAGLAASVGGLYGPWAAFALLLAVGLGLGVPLWLRAIGAAADARELAEAKGGREEFRGVPPAAGATAEEGGGQAYDMPAG